MLTCHRRAHTLHLRRITLPQLHIRQGPLENQPLCLPTKVADLVQTQIDTNSVSYDNLHVQICFLAFSIVLLVLFSPILFHLFKIHVCFTQKVLDSVSEGRKKLEIASQKGEDLCAYLPKPSTNNIQEQIAKTHQDFEGFLKQCLKDKQALEECVAELNRQLF